ncbi:MAG: hypothetical protein AAB036_07445 [Elusimicrobiota bacterium]
MSQSVSNSIHGTTGLNKRPKDSSLTRCSRRAITGGPSSRDKGGKGYYTGPIFEFRHASLSGSLGGGYRYDGLAERFAGHLQATGHFLSLAVLTISRRHRFNPFP